jgi:DNA-binding transcriptional LysR family regulator
VAEELHFSKAAERLNIAQPALSIQIKNLEEYLGGKLFIRNKRNVALTDAGKAMLNKSRQLINNMDELVRYSDMLFSGKAGHLNISYSGLAAYTGVMGKIIGHFREQYPEITISLEEHDPSEQLKRLQSEKVHIGFMTTMAKTVPLGLNSKYLTSSSLTLLFPYNHRLVDKKILSYEELRLEPFVIYASPQDNSATSIIEKICGFEPIVLHRSSTALLIPSLVSAGLGIAIIPAAFEKIAQDTGAVSRPLLVPEEMDISVIYPDAEQFSAVSRFIELLNETLLECPNFL